MPLLNRKTAFQFIRYIITGFTTLALDIGFYWFLVNTFNVWPAITPYIETPIILGFNYLMHKVFTFQGVLKKHSVKQTLRYVLVIAVNNVATSLTLYLLIDNMGIDYILGKIISIAIIIFWNFPMFKFWVYKDEKA